MPRKKLISLLTSLLAISIPVCAQAHQPRIIIAPNCLMKQMNYSHTVLATTSSFTLLETDTRGLRQFIAAKQSNKTLCGGFVNVTKAWHEFMQQHANNKQNAVSFLQNKLAPKKLLHKTQYSIHYEKQVEEILKQLNPQNMWDNLITLSNFQDRYADSNNGVEAASWLQTQMETLAKNNHRNDVTVFTIPTGTEYKQSSVVAKVGDSSEPGIVISAHMDTLSSRISKKPGADDDGSGSVTVLETARALLASNMHFKKPIYFIWYAAEEEGLVGSEYVVAAFKEKNIPIDAVLHFDLTGYIHNNELTMWLITDNVDNDLTNYLETLINTYVKRPVKRTRCGYACSDHATWTQYGYAASIPAETSYEDTNPNIHSYLDTMDKLSLTHMTDYAKLAAAFAVELAEPLAKSGKE